MSNSIYIPDEFLPSRDEKVNVAYRDIHVNRSSICVSNASVYIFPNIVFNGSSDIHTTAIKCSYIDTTLTSNNANSI